MERYECEYQDILNLEIFNTPYKIKFIGKASTYFLSDIYMFSSHGQFFTIAPLRMIDKCELKLLSEEEFLKLSENADYICNMEVEINKDSFLFESNIFSIRKNTYPSTIRFNEYSFIEEENLETRAKLHEIKCDVTLDQIIEGYKKHQVQSLNEEERGEL